MVLRRNRRRRRKVRKRKRTRFRKRRSRVAFGKLTHGAGVFSRFIGGNPQSGTRAITAPLAHLMPKKKFLTFKTCILGGATLDSSSVMDVICIANASSLGAPLNIAPISNDVEMYGLDEWATFYNFQHPYRSYIRITIANKSSTSGDYIIMLYADRAVTPLADTNTYEQTCNRPRRREMILHPDADVGDTKTISLSIRHKELYQEAQNPEEFVGAIGGVPTNQVFFHCVVWRLDGGVHGSPGDKLIAFKVEMWTSVILTSRDRLASS